jgi:hypothetical protein
MRMQLDSKIMDDSKKPRGRLLLAGAIELGYVL